MTLDLEDFSGSRVTKEKVAFFYMKVLRSVLITANLKDFC